MAGLTVTRFIGTLDVEMSMELQASYRPPSLLLDENAPERWIFLDYEDDGRVFALTPQQYESIYRPDPDDQGG